MPDKIGHTIYLVGGQGLVTPNSGARVTDPNSRQALTLWMSIFCTIDEHIQCPETCIICLMEKLTIGDRGKERQLVKAITSMMSDVSWTWTYNLMEPGWITANCCITPEGGYKWTMEVILA